MITFKLKNVWYPIEVLSKTNLIWKNHKKKLFKKFEILAGLNSLMLANCLFFVDVQEVRSSVLSQSSVLKILKYFEPCFITNVRKQFCFW